MLTPSHQHHIASSAIAPEIVAERGYWSALDRDEWQRRDGDMAEYQVRLPGIGIPVYQLGTPYTIILRPDRPRTVDKDGKTKTMKYEWPAGKPLCLDVLPRYRNALKDAQRPLVFTEGAKKADALASVDRVIVPISVNGVWGWCKKDADGTRRLLPDFNHLALKGRTVLLAFDSDYLVNDNVRMALDAFADALIVRGAKVGRFILPHGTTKLGVDDAIAQGWTFAQLVDTIEWYPEQASFDALPVSTPVSAQAIPALRTMPQLDARIADVYAHHAPCGTWLDQFMHFMATASSPTPATFTEAAGLFLAATAIARRLVCRIGPLHFYPNIYALFIAPPALYNKSTAINLMKDILWQADLSYLTLPDGMTPEVMQQQFSTAIPQNYDARSEVDKQRWLRQRGQAAQRAWIVDEASYLFDSFKREYNTGLQGMVLSFYDCPEEITTETISRGSTHLKSVALSFFGATTPKSIEPHLTNERYWSDGLWSRYALLTPFTEPVDAPLSEIEEIPITVIRGLQRIDQLFSKPVAQIVEDGSKRYVELYNLAAPEPALLDRGVIDAWQLYYHACKEVIRAGSVDETLSGSYVRFSTQAIKVAMLLAAMDAEQLPVRISLRHYARAQQIVEQWRVTMHYLLERGLKTTESRNMERIAMLLKEVAPRGMTVRTICQRLHLESDLVKKLLDVLEAAGSVECTESKANNGRKMQLWSVAQ